ncbi:hypothetical protein [Micromonospora sp. SD12]|uniref:hypothetical protein n=1 Tax=Micromonospora sp. SD12 TaxID=3452216 RepID=UPI003F8C9AF1
MLWAARRCLALLDPRSGLQLVRLEGMNPADVPDEDDQFLGCDLSECYGSDRLVSAERVVLTQLKYSVLHASTPWTAARLSSVKRRGGASVIKRLAEMFARIGRETDAEKRLAKLTIALVSNQPIDAGLRSALAAARAALNGRRPGTYAGTAFTSLSATERDLLGKLRQASGLSSGDFTDFVRVLDVDGCGSGSRLLQRLELGKELSALAPDGVQATPNLVQLMYSCMMPEAAGQAGLRAHDLLVALGASGTRSLFPFPPRITEPAMRVRTRQAERLAEAVAADTTRRLLAHGQPGVGKTTTVARLEEQLPVGSVLVAYDCYAAGDYQNPAEARHSSRAVVQIINDIALRTGTLPLVVRDALLDEGSLWQQFQDRVAVAAGTLPAGAVLVMVIDAADNSVTAAHRLGERSFVHRLWRITLPDNVRLVMTARSARRTDVLRGTDDLSIGEVNIPAFDLAASSDMLRATYPAASDDHCAAFHHRSRGFARVQAYALGAGDIPHAADPGGVDLKQVIERAGRQLSELFDEVLDTALAAIEDPDKRRAQIAVLAAMARPARISTLAQVMRVREDSIDRLVHDLAPGLVLGDAGVGFYDEDFEQHVRDVVDADDLASAHERFADYFSPRRHTDEEAARLLGEHLFNAGRGHHLVDLILDEGVPTAITDGLLRAQTFRSSISLALRSIAQPADPDTPSNVTAPADIVRLVLAAADAARTDSSHIDTVRAAPELAVLNSSPSAIAAILMREDSQPWRGKLHMRAAAVLAACGRRDEAAEQLAMAKAWLRAWARQADAGRSQFGASDVARAAVAAFLLEGVESGLRLVAGWRPLDFVERVTTEFLKLAPRLVPVKDIVQALRASSAGTLLQARAAAAYVVAGQVVPSVWVRQISARLDRLPMRRVPHRTTWGVTFCELALASGVSRARVRRLLARLGPPVPSHLSDPDAHSKVRRYLEAACLEAATRGRRADPEALAAELHIEAERQDYADRQRSLFRSACSRLIPVLQARAECLVAAATGTNPATAVDIVITTVRRDVEALTRRSSYPQDSRSDGQRVWFSAAATAVVAGMRATSPQNREAQQEPSGTGLAGQTPAAEQLQTLLRDLSHAASVVNSEGAPWIWMRMARDILPVATAAQLAIDLIGEAADAFEAGTLPASEIRDLLLEAAGVVHQHDPEFAADLFERAVRAAEGIDADVAVRLRTLTHIAAGAAGATGSLATSPEASATLARALTGALEDATPFVYDPREHLPHRFVLDVAAKLHGPTGLATALRWAQENRIDLRDALATVLPQIATNHTVNLANAFWLLRLLGTSGTIVDAAAPIVTAAASAGPGGRTLAATQLAVLAEWVARDITPAQRRTAADELCKLADRLGFNDLACIAQTRRLLAVLRELESPIDPGSTITSRNWSGAGDNAEGEVTLARQMSSVDEDLGILDRGYVGDQTVVEYLVTTASACLRSERVAVLDQLVGLVDRNVPGASARTIAVAVRSLLSMWPTSTPVRLWALRRLPTFVTDHLPELFASGSDPDGAYVISVVLPSEAEALTAALIEGTAAHLEGLTTAQLHAISRIMSDVLLGPQARASVVLSALAPPEAPPDSPLTMRVAQVRVDRENLPDPPEDQVGLLAATLWSLLGHEDRRYRWLAAHTLRLLVTHGSGRPLIRYLWDLANRVIAGSADPNESRSSFRALDLEFLAMSAVQWLLLVIARVAHDKPDAVVPIVDELSECALNTSSPHASIRELARRAVLAVAVASADAVPATMVERLRFANAPTACSVDRNPLRGSNRTTHTRFHFDTMDTVPYWFEPLARVFHNLTTADVARHADAWITDRWGRSNNQEQDPWLKRNADSWELTSNGHGSIPTIEIHSTYLEYHAMLCTAGELVDAGAQLEVDYRGRDAGDPWEEWLASFMPQSVDVWRADMRQAAPLRPITTGAWAKATSRLIVREDQPRESAGLHDFDPKAAVQQMLEHLRELDDDPEMVLVSGTISTYKHEWSCSAWMTSALVIPSAGRSLLHALAEDRAQPRTLPFAGAGVSAWDEIDAPGLRLQGWLVEERPDREGMDKHDPLACGLSHRLTFPAGDALTAMSLVPDRTHTRYTESSGALGARLRCWDEEDQFRWRGQAPHQSSGNYLAIRRDLLNDFLTKRQVSLVAVVHASLYRRRESRRDTRHAATRYLLIRAEGTEEQLDAKAK